MDNDYHQLKDIVFEFCNHKRDEGESFSLYDVHKMRGKGLIEADWNTSAVLYGLWLQSISELEVENFSDKEW